MDGYSSHRGKHPSLWIGLSQPNFLPQATAGTIPKPERRTSGKLRLQGLLLGSVGFGQRLCGFVWNSSTPKSHGHVNHHLHINKMTGAPNSMAFAFQNVTIYIYYNLILWLSRICWSWWSMDSTFSAGARKGFFTSCRPVHSDAIRIEDQRTW